MLTMNSVRFRSALSGFQAVALVLLFATRFAAAQAFPPSAIIGASVSDGFGATDPSLPPLIAKSADQFSIMPANIGGGPARAKLADVLGAMLHEDGTPLPSFSSSLFFMNAKGIAEGQLQLVEKLDPKPRLIIAIDFLFWHAYGVLPDDKRPALLEDGLKRLDRLGDATIVIADLPDMSHAIGKMLFKAQVPSKETLAILNERLNAWVKTKPNVIQVSLSQVVQVAMASGDITLGGKAFSGPASRALLGRDGLHATVNGLVALASEALLTLKARGVLAKDLSFASDPSIVLERIKAFRERAARGASSPAQEPAAKK